MLTSAALQLIAMLTMAIDHVGLYLVDNNEPMRAIGRIAFPLYAFMIAEGFRHTRSRRKYFIRLLILALISEPLLWVLATVTHVGYSDVSNEIIHSGGGWLLWFISAYPHSVIFTLILGFLGIACANKAEKQPLWYLPIPFLLAAAAVLNLDYGALGVALVIGFWFVRRHLKLNSTPYRIALFGLLAVITCLLSLQIHLPTQLFALLAFIPLALYSGEKGRRLPKYLFYAYYPAHLIVIVLIRMIIYTHF
ncbi:hypothetical protein IKF15_01650 [Candidatus Saccharibacteria bacterium]|nr:hypothetical protein [Candidatus Saccharibacteria bacterium]